MNHFFASLWTSKQTGYLFTCTLLIIPFSCQPTTDHQHGTKATSFAAQGTAISETEQPVEVLTFRTEKGWGYTILLNGRRFIHQPTIPAVGNNQSFDSEIKAQKTGQLVAYKIQHHLSPPAVSKEELDSLGVLRGNNDW